MRVPVQFEAGNKDRYALHELLPFATRNSQLYAEQGCSNSSWQASSTTQHSGAQLLAASHEDSSTCNAKTKICYCRVSAPGASWWNLLYQLPSHLQLLSKLWLAHRHAKMPATCRTMCVAFHPPIQSPEGKECSLYMRLEDLTAKATGTSRSSNSRSEMEALLSSQTQSYSRCMGACVNAPAKVKRCCCSSQTLHATAATNTHVAAKRLT
jgi:hypothetical protein